MVPVWQSISRSLIWLILIRNRDEEAHYDESKRELLLHFVRCLWNNRILQIFNSSYTQNQEFGRWFFDLIVSYGLLPPEFTFFILMICRFYPTVWEFFMQLITMNNVRLLVTLLSILNSYNHSSLTFFLGKLNQYIYQNEWPGERSFFVYLLEGKKYSQVDEMISLYQHYLTRIYNHSSL